MLGRRAPTREAAAPYVLEPGLCATSHSSTGDVYQVPRLAKVCGVGVGGCGIFSGLDCPGRGLGSGRPASSDDARPLPCGAGRLTTGGIQGDGRALQILNQDRRTLRRAPAPPPHTCRPLGAGWGTARSSRSPPYPAESAAAFGGPASPFYCARKPSLDIYRHGKSWKRGGKR